MNRREAVIRALRRERGGRVPHQIDFTVDMRRRMAGALGLTDPAAVGERVGNFCAQLNIGTVTGPSEGTIEEIRPRRVGENLYRDDWGVIWRRDSGDDLGVVVDPPLKEPGLAGFQPPQPASRAEPLRRFCRDNPNLFRLVSLSSPLFQRAWFLRGMDQFLMDLALTPSFVHELLDVVMDYTVKVVEEALRYDIDALFLMDDYGQQQGLIMSPDMWREYFGSRLKRLCGKIRERNVPVFFHSCGNVESIIPDLIDAGVDVLNPIQPELMDVFKIKEQYGKRLAFYGGVSTQQLLPYGTPGEIRADVKEKIRRLGEGGGCILAPAHAVQTDVPVENVLAFVQAMEEQ